LKEKKERKRRENYIYEKQNTKTIAFNTEIGIATDDNCFQENSLDLQKIFSCKNPFKYLFSLSVIGHDSSIFSVNSVTFSICTIVISNKSSRSKKIERNLRSKTNDPYPILIDDIRFAIICYREITFRDTIVRDERNNTNARDTRTRPKWSYLKLDT